MRKRRRRLRHARIDPSYRQHAHITTTEAPLSQRPADGGRDGAGASHQHVELFSTKNPANNGTQLERL